jgi:hypothetical protein
MFELKLSNGKVVTWNGKDGIEACEKYALSHPGAVVIAWRYPKIDIYVGTANIIQ